MSAVVHIAGVDIQGGSHLRQRCWARHCVLAALNVLASLPGVRA